ncbi:MAG TPA: hypothetical protein VK324_14530 [Tepidisphaeraceae bacterium]|nr:hypothetical protein [Tepidisphaeraceae bacterium]
MNDNAPDDRLGRSLSSPTPLNYATPEPAQAEQRHEASRMADGLVDMTCEFVAYGGELVSGVSAGLEAAGEMVGGLLDGL